MADNEMEVHEKLSSTVYPTVSKYFEMDVLAVWHVVKTWCVCIKFVNFISAAWPQLQKFVARKNFLSYAVYGSSAF